MSPRLSLSKLLPFLALLGTLPLQSEVTVPIEGSDRPLYEQMLQVLKNHDGVRPPRLTIYPVNAMYNREAIIPPQCYTRNLGTWNPCYVCHQAEIPERENVMNDDDLQAAYSFSETGMTNHWKNLFEDRRDRVDLVTDREIDAYVAEDNYSELSGRLKEAGFQGFIPDLDGLEAGAAAFDEEGFARDGSHWVAFNYKPFPSTFWPANGSTDDVMIRLGDLFRQDEQGKESRDVYKANLALVEASVKGLDSITCLPVDETQVGRDLDGDGQLGLAHRIAKADSFVGAAKVYPWAKYLYPPGTEFLHTVRYLGITQEGEIVPSRRMKEVRYMKKWKGYPKVTYARQYELESFEKEAGNLPGYPMIGDHGLDNGNGWSISGFIENSKGRLRVLTHEENFSCMGCHNSIGSTIDKTFSFPRKVDGAAGWGYINLHGMPDAPNVGEKVGEIATYFQRVGGGSEFRNNDEIRKRFFRPDGTLDHLRLREAKDVYDLIVPSAESARRMNKAYRTIVQDQDFIHGKDAVMTPPENVFPFIDNKTATTLPEHRQYRWNILLDWPDAPSVVTARP